MTASSEGPEFAGSSSAQGADWLAEKLGNRVVKKKRLTQFSTFRLGGPAEIFVEAQDESDLAAVGEAANRFHLDVFVIGKGSNLLISDEGIKGVVLKLGSGFEQMKSEGSRVVAGGAAFLPQVANFAGRRGLSGLEFAAAIPASVGGAVRMNAGAHGACVADVLESARIYRIDRETEETFTASDLRMKYRRSAIGMSDVVCSATFDLRAGEPSEISARMKQFRVHRSETQPSTAPNAGSVFRNPKGQSAGGLIEAAGLKGLQHGDAEVSGKHANFFTAGPKATAQDVFELMVLVQQRTKAETGVTLAPEVRTIGRFQDADRLEVE